MALIQKEPRKLSLYYSPCPNDTFMFDAMIHHKIDTEGLEFEVYYEDIEKLNQGALQGTPDMTKLSTKTISLVLDKYRILNSGAAIGFGVGPLLLAKEIVPNWKENIFNYKIGIPGVNTTANFLLDYAFPENIEPGLPKKIKIEMVFYEIETALLNRKIDLGLVIHESRFTYEKRGLKKLLDLGSYWEEKTGLPIPLAGIVVRKTIPYPIQIRLDRVLKRSIEYAFTNPQSSLAYIRAHSQEMEDEVIQKHIHLYVNELSLDLGLQGRNAFLTLFKYFNSELIREEIFLEKNPSKP